MASTTGQLVFETTMAMIDELNDSGTADYADTTEYKNRTLPILNILQGELYPYSYVTFDNGSDRCEVVQVDLDNKTINTIPVGFTGVGNRSFTFT